MRLVATKPNETLDDLVARVYEIEKPTQEKLKEASGALTKANPFLRKLDDVPAGTLVLVPELEGAKPSPKTEAPRPAIEGIAADHLRGAIDLTAELLAGALDEELSDTRESAKLMRSADLKRAAGEDESLEGLKGELPKLVKITESRADDARELRKYHKQVFDQVEKDLQELLGVEELA